jgi:hypothetical protein
VLAPVASKFSTTIQMIVARLKIDFPLRIHMEVVYGPIAAIEGNRLTAYLSDDEGQTWKWKQSLETEVIHASYPSVV